MWLGFCNYSPHNVTNPGVWRDTNGTGTVLSFSKWKAAEPNDGLNDTEKCVVNVATQSNNTGTWQDVSCTAISYYYHCMCQCPNLVVANGTVITPPAPAVNYTAQILCDSGFQLVGSPTLTCKLNPSLYGLSWDLPPPSCVNGTTTTTTTTPTTTTPDTTATTTSATTATTVTIAAASQIPHVSAAEFLANLDTNTNGVDSLAVASQLNSAMEILISGLSPTDAQQLGYQRNEFVTACLFSGIPCNNDETLTLVQIPEFLNCYAFNHRDQTNLFTSERSGEKFGLSMAFNIQSEEYINTVAIAGVQLFVQDQFDSILPGSMGRIYSPGQLYHIIFSKRIENQLSVPGRPCITSAVENSFSLFQNDTYFTDSCLRSYVQLNIIKNCGCGSTKYPLPNNNSKFCNLTTAKCASAYLTAKGVKLIEEAQKACPPACRSVSFDLTTTFAKLSPQQSLLNSLNMSKSVYMNNMVMVKLFSAKDTVMVYTEGLNFNVMNTFANLGGSLGCIAGISVISLVEVIFMLAQGVTMLKKKCH